MDGFTWEGANNAWNDLGSYFDLGTPGGLATVVSQPAVGLCPNGRIRSCSPHRRRSRASRPNLEFASAAKGRRCDLSPEKPSESGDCARGNSKLFVACGGLPGLFPGQAAPVRLEDSDG